MTSVLLVDFETRSFAKLKRIGGRRYAEHWSTQVLCACVAAADDAGEWHYARLWRPGEWPLGETPDVVVAHYAIGFDRHIWRRLGWPEPKRWLDTAVMARRAGYASASLEAIGERYGMAKDTEGNRLTLGLSQAHRKDSTVFMRNPEAVRDRVLDYCESDVRLMARIYDDLAAEYDFAAFPPGTWQAWEESVYQADLAVGDRGIVFDTDFAKRLIAAEADAADDACSRAGVTAAQMRSVPQFKQLTQLPTARRGDLVEHKRNKHVAARLACTSITAGKLRAGLDRVSDDGRLRDMTRYFGAHTGRWSGQGVQTQNLPRGESVCTHTPKRGGCLECLQDAYEAVERYGQCA